LGSRWFPAIPDVHARLQASPPARVADLGCGCGWSSIAIARAYPTARVDGFDVDPQAIALAQQHAADAGLAERVAFRVMDAADPGFHGRYDLVTAFETLHDMPHPVPALRTMRRLAEDGGAVIVVDEKVAPSFEAPADPVTRVSYGWSVLSCLPSGMVRAGGTPAGTGAVMRPSTLASYARAAGFRDVETLPVEHDAWRFYRLRA
jgi:ubiquinone/menaquinone biosynthesis C-methylase UbiE